ncbi:hypothetical protein CYMTET_41621, partial [Cymbomonas tetramitiformis]
SGPSHQITTFARDLGGVFPREVAGLKKVPGIGAYTAGAIASIAFEDAEPLVDGNVVRVVSRLRTVGGDPTKKEAITKHWELAGELVHQARPGDLNQALMELGAVICTAKSPTCSKCPVQDHCWALQKQQEGKAASGPHAPLVTDFPHKKIKAAPREEAVAISVVDLQTSGKDGASCGKVERYTLLVRRPDKGLLAGLWEFPSVIVEAGRSLEDARANTDAYLASIGVNVNSVDSTSAVQAGKRGNSKRRKLAAGGELERRMVFQSREPVGEVLHIFSHIRQQMLVERVVINGSPPTDIPEGLRWVRWEELDPKVLTSGVRKVHELISSQTE